MYATVARKGWGRHFAELVKIMEGTPGIIRSSSAKFDSAARGATAA